MVGPGRGQCQVVQHHDDDPPFTGERADDRHDVELVAKVERAGRLVEKKQLRGANDRLREAGELALASRQTTNAIHREIEDTEPVQHVDGATARLGTAAIDVGQRRRLQCTDDAFQDGEFRILRQCLRHVGDTLRAFPQTKSVEVDVAEPDRAGRMHQTGEAAQQGRLAGGIGADQRRHLSGLKRRKVQVAHHRPIGVAG